MEKQNKTEEILSIINRKATMKQNIYDHIQEAFKSLKVVLQEIEKEYNKNLQKADKRILLEYKNRGIFQCELKVGGDLLVFILHSNVFEFDRDHGVWKTSYIKSSQYATYSGLISVYNFLADSFKYQRSEDLGYLIARIFVNKDKHYFVEGKRQMGYLHNTFGKEVIDKKAIRNIIESAILYTLQFDLLVPPYEAVKILNVEQINERQRQTPIQTAKRLGFSFNADDVHGENLQYTGG